MGSLAMWMHVFSKKEKHKKTNKKKIHQKIVKKEENRKEIKGPEEIELNRPRVGNGGGQTSAVGGNFVVAAAAMLEGKNASSLFIVKGSC